MRHEVVKRDGAYYVVDMTTGKDADGPYPPLSAEREPNLLDLAWAEGKRDRLEREARATAVLQAARAERGEPVR